MRHSLSSIGADRLINTLLFSCALLMLLFPFFSIVLAGKSYAFTAIGLLTSKPISVPIVLLPAAGWIVSALSVGQKKTRGWILAAICLIGLVSIFIAKPLVFEYGDKYAHYAWGSFCSMALYALGAVHNVILLVSVKQQG